MTPLLLRQIGEALWGLSWQSAMARELGVADRTVRRWAASERAIPEALADNLRASLANRRAEIDALLGRLAA